MIQTQHPSNKSILEMLFFLLIAILIMYYKHGYIYNDCYFNDPVLSHVRTNHTSLEYCVNNKNHNKLEQLILFIKIYCKDQACTASEFGSYVRVMYMKQRDLILINPIIENKSEETNVCYGKQTTTVNSLQTSVKYLNEDLKVNNIKFYALENCLFEQALGML